MIISNILSHTRTWSWPWSTSWPVPGSIPGTNGFCWTFFFLGILFLLLLLLRTCWRGVSDQWLSQLCQSSDCCFVLAQHRSVLALFLVNFSNKRISSFHWSFHILLVVITSWHHNLYSINSMTSNFVGDIASTLLADELPWLLLLFGLLLFLDKLMKYVWRKFSATIVNCSVAFSAHKNHVVGLIGTRHARSWSTLLLLLLLLLDWWRSLLLLLLTGGGVLTEHARAGHRPTSGVRHDGRLLLKRLFDKWLFFRSSRFNGFDQS